MSGFSGTVTPFHAAVDAMIAGKRPWDTNWLESATEHFPNDDRLAVALAIAKEPDDRTRNFLRLRHQRDLLVIQSQQRRNDKELRRQLEGAEFELAEAEAALPV